MRTKVFFTYLLFLCSIAKATECSNLFSDQSIDKETQMVIAKALTITHKDFIEHFSGRIGYLYISEKYYESNMFKAYADVLYQLGRERFKELGWPSFKGTTIEYRTIGDRLVKPKDASVKIDPAFVRITGEMRYASMYYADDVHIAYRNVEAVLEPSLFELLGWKDFLGNVTEMQGLRNLVVDPGSGRVFNMYIGPYGFERLAHKKFFDDKVFAFMKIFSVLSDAEIKALRWENLKLNSY